MEITVKQTHIDAGTRFNGCKCPIALAVKEQAGLKIVVVALGKKKIIGYRNEYDLHPDAVVFGNDFDDGKPVEPFMFELVK